MSNEDTEDDYANGYDCGDLLYKRLVKDVRLLTRHAIEIGQLPDTVNAPVVFATDQDHSQATLKQLVTFYEILEKQFPSVTAQTLAATEQTIPGKIKTCSAGRYLTVLWYWIAFVVMAILLSNIIQFSHDTSLPDIGDEWGNNAWLLSIAFQASQYFEPFLYGALGSFVFLLRVSEERLKERSFDPNRKGEHFNRVILGAISGGAIILLIAQIPAGDGNYIEISAAALGFLAGYSIDFLFHTIDRVIQAILPKVGLDTIQQKTRQRQTQKLVQRYQAQLSKASTPEEKQLLEDIIDKLGAM